MKGRVIAIPLMLLLLLGQGCVFTPQTTTVYDDTCRAYKKQFDLDMTTLGPIGSCVDNESCLAMLAGAGVLSAASMVVSGSIVVVGNVVYWLELQGECHAERVQKDD